MASVLSTKYARALLDLLTDSPEAELETVLRELRAFEELYETSSELRAALTSPAVVVAARRRVITSLAERLGLSDLVKRFLFVVCDHGRMPLLSDIRAGIEEQIDERLGRVTAQVGIATNLPEAQREAIRSRLAAVTGKQVRTQFTVDDDLIGGFRAEIGSTLYDASVKGQFDALRRSLGEVA